MLQLCIVTLALLETLIDLNCEDILLELILKYLLPCTHIMLSQRNRIQRVDPYCGSTERFLSLMIQIPKLVRLNSGVENFTNVH